MKTRWLKKPVLQEEIFLNAFQCYIFIDGSPPLYSTVMPTEHTYSNEMWLQD